ncbi:MAG: AAA family ATPase [Elusimicrobiales bacterium]|nr:AAA family ATPase [Elusimicrobiales bacterium]
MKLREIKIKNFRNLVDIAFPVDDTIVLIGENNTGKTALLDALKLMFSRGPGSRAQAFDDYDFHMEKAGDTPQKSQGISIELWFNEDVSDEWPESLVQALTEIIQTDPITDIDSIGFRTSSKFDSVSRQFVTKCEFLAIDGQPLSGKAANPANISRFWEYVRLFSLSAMRDAEKEFSPRSAFWGRILRDLKITDEQRKVLSEELVKLNETLLTADPRLEQVRSSLDNVQKIINVGIEHSASIQAIPMKPWELMAKSEIVIRGAGGEVDFPLNRHGQGMQSLAVLFLFQAYLEVLLKPTHKPETEAILALDEVEAHLHPQATRALSASLAQISSQKILSTHSPYFIQDLHFSQIRMFRRNGASSRVMYIKRVFKAKVPQIPGIATFCAGNPSKFAFNITKLELSVRGRLEEREYRSLLTLYPGQLDVHAELKRLKEDSCAYLGEDELRQLDTYVKRIRGEILFSRSWLLCEGQSEYLLLRYFAELLGKPFDRTGVSLVDYQNNGSPGAFVGLAEAFQIPWAMICDNDSARNGFMTQLQDRGITASRIATQVFQLPEPNMQWEMFLAKNGFLPEYVQIIGAKGQSISLAPADPLYTKEIVSKVQCDKIGYTTALIDSLKASGANSSRVPSSIVKIINDLVGAS